METESAGCSRLAIQLGEKVHGVFAGECHGPNSPINSSNSGCSCPHPRALICAHDDASSTPATRTVIPSGTVSWRAPLRPLEHAAQFDRPVTASTQQVECPDARQGANFMNNNGPAIEEKSLDPVQCSWAAGLKES